MAGGEGFIKAFLSQKPLASRLLVLACCCAALLLTFIGLFEFDVPLTRFIRTLNLVQTDDLANPWLARLSHVGDRLGKGESLVIMSLAILAAGFAMKRPVWKAAGWQSLLAHGAAGVVNNLLKHLVGRARPKFMHAGTLELSPVSGSGWDSFPSGHAMASFAVAAVLAVKFPKLRHVLLFLACAIAASRIVRGSHFLTDVAGGALFGCLIGSVAANPWREWRSSLETALFAFTPFLVALLAIVWTIGHHPPEFWPASLLIGLGSAIVLLGLAGRVVMRAWPAVLPAFFTRPVAQSLIGLGLGMVTGSVWVLTAVLLVCAAYWLRSQAWENALAATGGTAGPASLVQEALFVAAVLAVLLLSFELRGALPML